ncbi:MAG TPA: SRPBCC family protein [Propionibacteriaceae bacterium]
MTPTPTGQMIPTAIGRDLVLERVLPGSIDDAWASITDSDRLARWFCTWTGEPRVGATLELTLVAEEGDATSRAEILACEPPTHLAVSTHDQGGTWLIEATLTPIDSNHTRLGFVHHLDEEAKSEEVGPGWEYYLDRLVAAMCGNPMPDFDDYWPSLAAAYADRTSDPES